MSQKCVNLCRVLPLFLVVLVGTWGCQPVTSPQQATPDVATSAEPPILQLPGRWLNDTRTPETYFVDPQSSGLTFWQDRLVSISDASANSNHQRRLHFIDPATTDVTFSRQYRFSNALATTCFNQYLAGQPDLEALTKDPYHPNTFISVTEDARRSGSLSRECAAQFRDTGSTAYPTVLVRLQYDPDTNALEVTGVRAVQFAMSDNVGDAANDGIEGLYASNEQILLGLEKDANNQAQVFSVPYTVDFWQRADFVQAQRLSLALPQYDPERPTPINGMDVVHYAGETWLIAAARNHNELWWVNLSLTASHEVYRVNLEYVLTNPADSDCPAKERMHNASLEGVAVSDDMLYLVNDPWKRNYHKNLQCGAWESHYAAYAPLLFATPLAEAWQHKQLFSVSLTPALGE
jgi:hypothetical protein